MDDTDCSQPVHPDEGIDWAEHRKFKRKPVLWPAKLDTPGGRHDCITLDLSLGGAKLRVADQIALEPPVTLLFEPCGALRGEVVWVDERSIGMRFTDAPAHIARVLSGKLPL